jgi:hypothetical protein
MFNWRKSDTGEPTRRLDLDACQRQEQIWRKRPPMEPGYYLRVELVSSAPYLSYPKFIQVQHGGDLGMLYRQVFGRKTFGGWLEWEGIGHGYLYYGPMELPE